MDVPITYIGRYAKVDPNNPEPIGFCDRTGIPFNRKDLVKQMEWVGNTLVWTGWLVGRPFLDTPNQQNKIPPVKADPIPVKDPRDKLPARELSQAEILSQLMSNNYHV